MNPQPENWNSEPDTVRRALDAYPRIQASRDFNARVLDAILTQASRPPSFFERLDLFFAHPLRKVLGSTALGMTLGLLIIIVVALPHASRQSAPLPASAPLVAASSSRLYAFNRWRLDLADIDPALEPRAAPTALRPRSSRSIRRQSWHAAT